MAFKFLSDHFSITRDSNHFIQLKTLKHPKTSDEVWVAFSIEGESKFARATVQDLVDTFEAVFFDAWDSKTYERFENALREMNLIYKNIQDKKGSKALGNLSAVVALFSGSELHLSQCNEAEAYLIRNDRLSPISEGLSEAGDDIFVNIASGEILPEDKVVLSTSRLLRNMSQAQLVNSCRNGVTETIDAIREYMMEAGDFSLGVSCVHAQVPYRHREGESLPVASWKTKLNQLWEKGVGTINGKMAFKSPVNRNTLLVTILAVILLLIISISVLLEKSRNQALREEYQEKIQALHNDINTANTKGHTNERSNANIILDRVEEEATLILKSNFFRTEVLEILKNIQVTRDEINNTLRIKDPSPYADLRAKNPSAQAIGLNGTEEHLFAFESSQIYKVILDQVLEPKPVNQDETFARATYMEALNNMILLTQSGRIMEYSAEALNTVNTQDESWKKGVDIAAYDRFLYILSPENNQIYKYSRGNSGYSVSTEYNENAELSDAIALAIDGSVYVLKKNGEILRLFKGRLEKFQVEDLALDLAGANDILTTPEMKHLYVLHSDQQKIVVLEKNVGSGARYRGQIQFDGIQLKGLYVNKGESLLYALSESAIYKVDLNDLESR